MMGRVICVENVPFQVFTEIRVSQSANQHMRAKIVGIVNEEFAVDCGVRGIYSRTVSVQVFDEYNRKFVWLSGMVDNFCISVCGGVYVLSLEIVSFSKKSDIKKHTRTFQDPSLTYEDVISILEDNSGEEKLEVLIYGGVKTTPINTFLVQYEETDWEFLKRLASRCHSYLFPCANIERNGIYIGIYSHTQVNVLDTTEYVIQKDMNEFYYNQIDSTFDYHEASAICYIVKSYHIYNLCDCICLNGMELYVYAIESELVGSHLIHTYTLKKDFGFQTRTTFNNKLAGVALTGEVFKIQKDMVQVRVDDDIEQRSYRWFPYSTVYSSSDNTGWYFMPEIGDKVRLVFPNEYEADSYVVSSVHMGERSEPDIKSIRTCHKKEIVFSPESLFISNGTGSHIELHDSNGITIYSDKQIMIESGDNIDIKGQEGINVVGNTGVVLQQKGNRIDIDDTIDITAGRLRLR
mgnify:CR=1 FL=1